ncbi:RagB/SusD family nutrient uptake outer membrane protein [Pedobacter nyackensis]|uniref:SusD family protein n=1 Tax=Pedobacter nyackensis TaxID=475255 RepID=A0A1W2BCJ1_9SPHI|nr:RagB/SusD family nutrient uptake outer membrane protein [Pedobacter nyackensis]SMC70432.1 SusD family protein [Pedobacter nyackensis]
MKKLSFIILALLSVLSIISCKKFLTVTPKTEMPKDLLLSSESGFKDALTGVYIQMREGSAYGGNMTQTSIESLISSWDVTTGTVEQKLGLFNFTDSDVDATFGAIYAQEYKIIASVNAILEQIDAKKDLFAKPEMYQTIKSECLAIRAYCHMDVLRLFGPVPSAPGNGNMLPYVTTLSTSPNPRIPFNEFQTALFKDLEEAEALVKDIDPITKYSLSQLRNPGTQSGFNPEDTYLAFRYLRMNYYAIKALQARAYLWFNIKHKAFECAKLVIDAKNVDGTTKFRLGSSADFSVKDFVLTNEHMFGLYDFEMFNKYTSRYSSGTLKKGTAATTINTQLYGNTGTDIRETGLWELGTLANGSKIYIIKKYQAIDSKLTTITTDFKQIPMLRLSEMYLIAAESAPFNAGLAYFSLFRESRNIKQLAIPANEIALQAEIIKEYRKEFYAEGQSFFAYKRLNVQKPVFLFAPSAAIINYLLPLPARERN